LPAPNAITFVTKSHAEFELNCRESGPAGIHLGMKLILAFALNAAVLLPFRMEGQTEVYSNDFRNGVASKVEGTRIGLWRSANFQKMPDNKTWLLGTFGGKAGKQTSLVLENLPVHKALVIIVDLVFINDWSHSNANFQVAVRSSEQGNSTNLWSGNPASSLTPNSSGDYGLPGNPDQTYHLMLACQHAAKRLLVDFIKGVTERDDMAFGIRSIRVLAYPNIDTAVKSIPPEQELLQLHHFPIKTRAAKSFEDGGGADWVIDTSISRDGRLDFMSNIKAHRSLNGWCGRFALYLFDQQGNVLAQFGMGDDHCWCVNGRLSPASVHERNDHLVQQIPRDMLLKMRSLAFDQVSTSGCHSIISPEDVKAVIKILAGAANQQPGNQQPEN
jgi:hypothetical protein